MPLPTSPNFPSGLETISIESYSYIVDAMDMPSDTTRQIVRQDENGDYSDSQTRAGADPITGTMTLQRATINTPRPSAGSQFTCDYERIGTEATLEVTDVKTARSKTEADVFEIGVKFISYPAAGGGGGGD